MNSAIQKNLHCDEASFKIQLASWHRLSIHVETLKKHLRAKFGDFRWSLRTRQREGDRELIKISSSFIKIKLMSAYTKIGL